MHNEVKYFPKFDWPRVSTPNINFPLDEKNSEDVIRRENISLKQIKDAIQKNKGISLISEIKH